MSGKDPVMLRKDGVPFNRETEQARWDWVDELETRLLRAKSVYETVADLDTLFQRQAAGAPEAPDAERVASMVELQRRLRALARARGDARG